MLKNREKRRARAPLKGIAVAEGDLGKLITNPSTWDGKWDGIRGDAVPGGRMHKPLRGVWLSLCYPRKVFFTIPLR